MKQKKKPHHSRPHGGHGVRDAAVNVPLSCKKGESR